MKTENEREDLTINPSIKHTQLNNIKMPAPAKGEPEEYDTKNNTIHKDKYQPFMSRDDGVYRLSREGEEKRICSAIWMEAAIRTPTSEDWHSRLYLKTPDGDIQPW